ncbi:MAG: hypothetical protein CVT76_11095, partial [Alphaproteobacteria bacterium HGW-Alphaproteobacteria-15]
MSIYFSLRGAVGAIIALFSLGALSLPIAVHAQAWSVQDILDNPEVQNSGYGVDVAIEGNIALIGDFRDTTDANGNNPIAEAGAAYVYEKTPTGWQLLQKLVPSDRQSNTGPRRFGTKVALSGEHTLLISAPSGFVNPPGPPPAVSNAGAAYFFVRSSPTGPWVQAQKVSSPNPQAGGFFGYDIDLKFAGDIAVIGAPREPASGTPKQTG